MNEEYLRALHKSLKVDDDYDTWINAVQGNEEYLRGLHGFLGVDDDYETWYSAVLGKKKEFPQPLDSEFTGAQGDTSGSTDVIEERLKKSQQGNQDFYENYPTDTEIYDLQQGVASPDVISKTYSWLSKTDSNTANLTDEQLQEITTLKGVMKEQEAKLFESEGELGVTGMTKDLAQDMEVAGQRARGEAVDGAPRRKYERSFQFKTSADDIMISLQELEDEAEVFDFLDASEQEISEFLSKEELKKRRYGEETINEYKDRIEKDKLERAEEDLSISMLARTLSTIPDNKKSIFETEEQYKARLNKVSDTELKNAEYRIYQQRLLEVQKQIDEGILSENSIQVKDFTRLMAEDLGLDPNTATYDSISKSITETKDFLESRLFESTLDRELYKRYLQLKDGNLKDFTYTRRATSDFVMNLVNDIGIYAADNFINDPLTAERLQQKKASRNLRAQIALGHDPYDSKGITERFQEGGFWDETAWEKLMLSFGDSYISLASAVVNPMAGVAIAGASGTFSTYEAYRDRGDLTEAEKQTLAWGSGLIEAGITYIGMGNIRKARKALGVVDDIASATTSQKRKLYNAAIDKMRPVSKRVAAAMQSSRVQAAGTFAFSVLEEEAEELSIGILTQGLAHVIADEDYDIYELADIAISTFGMSGGMSSINTYSTYSKYKNHEAVATADKMERMESLKGYYEDLKKTFKEEGISKEEKAVIKEEMRSVRDEILTIKAESIAQYENLSEEDSNRVAAINREIRKAVKVAKDTDSPLVKDSQKRKIEKLLDIKGQIEGKSRAESVIDRGTQEAEILQSGKTIQAPETAEPQGVELQTASQLAQDLENKLEERKQKSAKKETAKDAVDTRVRYLNPATNQTVEGVLVKDGQRLAVETDEGNIIDIENFEEVADQKLEDLNLSVAEGLLGVNEDGSFTYNRAGGVAPQGTTMVNRNGVRAIRRDKNGDVKNVLLTTPDGSRTFNLKGEEAQEAAYQILLKETQNADDVSKVDEELRLQAIEDARREAEEKGTPEQQPTEPTKETQPADTQQTTEQQTEEAARRAERRQQRKDNIETVGDVNLTEENKTRVSKMLDALSIVAPNLKIVMHSSRDSYNKTHPNASKDVGHWDLKNTIHVLVDGTNPLNLEGYMLLKHEMVHPILEAIIASDPKFANRIENRIKRIMNRYAKGTDAQKRVLDHYQRYAKRSDQSLELLTEFITVFSEPAGVKLLSRNRTAFEQIADLFQYIIDRIKGFRDAKIPSSQKEIIALAKSIGEALQNGSALDIDKTTNQSIDGAVRSSLERSSDPNKAIQPKKGTDAAEVSRAWIESKNNFIVAEDFEHSLELRRLGFKEVYQSKNGKIFMSVPVTFDEYNPSSQIAKMTSEAFIKAGDINDKRKKRVHDTLKELAKFSGYKMEFIDRADLKFESAMVVPDANNKLSDNTVVVNLAYANARTGASGMSMVLVETLRRKAPEAFNSLYKNMIQGKSPVKDIFDSYVKAAKKRGIKSNEDAQLVAMANVFQELIDSATTEAVGDGLSFVEDFQSNLAEALTNQEGDIKLARLPLGDNMILAIESGLIGKNQTLKFDEDIEATEKTLIQRLSDAIKRATSLDVSVFEKAYKSISTPVPLDFQSAGFEKFTLFDALYAAGYDENSDELMDLFSSPAITEFLGDDVLLEKIGTAYGAMASVSNSPRSIERIEAALENRSKANRLSGKERIVFDFLNDYINFLPSQEADARWIMRPSMNANEGILLDDVSIWIKDFLDGRHIRSVVDFFTGDLELANQSKRHTDAMQQSLEIFYGERLGSVSTEQRINDFASFIFESSLDAFEEINHKAQQTKGGDPKVVSKIEESKTLLEALKNANMAAPNVSRDGVFRFKIEKEEFKKYFPSIIPKGAETVFNDKGFVEINLFPLTGGGFNVSYDVAYKGKIVSYADFPSSWGVGRVVMPIVFKYVSTVGALTNAKYISFSAADTSINDDIVKDFGIDVYSKPQIESFKGKGSPVLRRGLNNLAAFNQGSLVGAKTSKNVGVILDGKLYSVKDSAILKYVNDHSVEGNIQNLIDNDQMLDVADALGGALEIGRPELAQKIKDNTKPVDLKGKGILAVAHEINSNSYTLPSAEKINNNPPMTAAYDNSEKYVSLGGVRSMLSPETKNNGRKTLESTDQMFQNAEEKIIGKGKGIKPFIKRYFSREALVTTSARLQKAMEKGFEDFIKAQFTALNGQRANADRDFKKIEKRVFGGLNTTEETLLNKIIFLRRVIQIDTNWDNRLRENEASLQQSKNTLISLEALAKNAKTKSEKKQIKEEISRVKKAEKYYQQQVDKYSVRPLHPSDGTIEMNRENAIDALNTLQEDLGDSYTNLYGRADAYFDEYKKILQESYEAGLIDEETRDRFINDDYSPRVFLEKMFGETANAEFEHMNLGTDQIASIKNGSNQEIFTDARYLLNLSLRSLRHRTAHNSLFAAMDEQAAAMQYKMKDDTVREAKYKKDKAGNIIEDSFGNRETEKADEGYSNIFYRVDGKKRAFQIKSELYNALMGIEDRNLMSPKARRRAARVSGTSTKKALVTGLRPAFAFIASARGMVEVTRGRGVYDNLYFLPLMQMAALTDFLRSMPAAVMDGALVDDYFKHGGGMSFLTNQGRPQQIYKKKRSTVRRLLGQYSPLKGAGRALSFLGEKSEIALRLAIYTRTLKNLEKTRPELTETQRKYLAVEEARMIADFSQGGYLTKDLDSFKPYLNAAIQGTRGTLNYARKNPKMFAFKQIQAAAIHTASTVLAMMYLGDDEWEKIPAYIKNRYLLIPLFMKGDNGQPLFLRIPKAHQFMFLDHFAVMAGEAYYNDNQGKEYNWKMYEKDKNGDPTGYLSEQGFAMVDAFFGSLPAGDLIPEEVFTPKKITLGNVSMQILSTMPAAGALDAYYNNIDRYRESRISYDKDKVPAYMEGYKDGRTRDIFKLTSKLFGGSDKRQQVAFEKLYANESSVIVNLMYQLTDAVITTAEEKEGIQRAEDRKRKIDASLGLKRSFIYEVPEKKYDNSKSKAFEDINKEERAKKKVIRTEIGILLKNNDFDSKEFGGFPKYLIDYVSKIPTEDVAMRRYARGYAKNRAIGFDTEPIFYEIANAETPAAQVEMLQIAYEFDKWNDLPVDVRNTIVEELVRAGLKDKRGLAAELRK